MKILKKRKQGIYAIKALERKTFMQYSYNFLDFLLTKPIKERKA